jgi:hypothetical protein
MPSLVAAACARIANSPRFQGFIFTVDELEQRLGADALATGPPARSPET